MKKAKEFRDQAVEELEATLTEKRESLFQLRNTQAQEKKVEKPHLIKQTKREIACLLTILTEKKGAGTKK